MDISVTVVILTIVFVRFYVSTIKDFIYYHNMLFSILSVLKQQCIFIMLLKLHSVSKVESTNKL